MRYFRPPSLAALVITGLALSACGNDRQAGEVADWWYDGTPRDSVATYEDRDGRGTVVAPPLNGNDNTIFSGQRR